MRMALMRLGWTPASRLAEPGQHATRQLHPPCYPGRICGAGTFSVHGLHVIVFSPHDVRNPLAWVKSSQEVLFWARFCGELIFRHLLVRQQLLPETVLSILRMNQFKMQTAQNESRKYQQSKPTNPKCPFTVPKN